MSWWFPRLNRRGEVVSGNGTLLLNGSIICPAYSPVWGPDDDHVIAGGVQKGDPAEIINVRTLKRTPLAWSFSPRIGNISGVSAGPQAWCGWSESTGLVVNGIVDADLKLSAPGCIDRLSGALGYMTPYHADSQGKQRDVFYDARRVRQGVVADEIRCADGAACWSEWTSGVRKIWGAQGGGASAMILSVLPPDEPEFAGIPVLVDVSGGSSWWMVLQTAAGIILYPWHDAFGYVLEGEFAYPDAMAFGQTIRVVATTSTGQRVDVSVDLTKPRRDLREYHPSGGGHVPERPIVTITSFEPKSGQVPPDLSVRAVAALSGGPADRLIWSQQKNGGPWQVVAPNNAPDDPDHTYKFSSPGTYGLKVKVEGPGGSDETGTPRLVTVTQKDEPPPPPQRAKRFWFGPNIGSLDMLKLFTEKHSWAHVRERVDVFQFYLQHILDVGGGIGPNNYNALKDAGAFKMLTEEGILIAVEMGSVKAGHCDAVRPVEMMKEAQQKILDAGGRLSIIATDEPLVSGLGDCNMAVAQVADGHAMFQREGKKLGLSVGWIEAYPHVSFDTQAEFLQDLDERGGRPEFWHLDVDRKRAQDEGKPFDTATVARFRAKAVEHDLPLGIILVGYPHETDAEYVADVLAWSAQTHSYWTRWDQVKVQSWATRGEGGPQDIPANVPEGDSTKHTALLQQVIEVHS